MSDNNGKLSSDKIRSLINKNAGSEVAFNLNKENPTEVPYWIPTGSRWLDSIIAKGMKAGIPGAKISGIAGLSSTGKSFMAAQIAANAQDMGMDIIYFDSESAQDPSFLEDSGVDLDNLIYVQAKNVEFVLETIEDLLGENENRMLFIWDSIAFTPCKSELESDYNPNSSVSLKARILSKLGERLSDPIADTESCLLLLNQLKTYIPKGYWDRHKDYFEVGGKGLHYACSLRIWLTRRSSKSAQVENEKGYNVGCEVKARLEKSRFGTERRECAFDIMWGEEVGIKDEESWLEAIKHSDRFKNGRWKSVQLDDGEWCKKFQNERQWRKRLEDPELRKAVLDIMDEEIIQNFENQTAPAEQFYDIDGENDE